MPDFGVSAGLALRLEGFLVRHPGAAISTVCVVLFETGRFALAGDFCLAFGVGIGFGGLARTRLPRGLVSSTLAQAQTRPLLVVTATC
jgi:hypothetical protein